MADLDLDFVRSNMRYESTKGVLYWRVPGKGRQANKPLGTQIAKGYRVIRVDGAYYCIHRIIFALHHGFYPEVVDHINGNPKDNRVENLRAATPQQNRHNSKRPANNTSGFKWVQRTVDGFKYVVVVDGKRYCKEGYSSAEVAHSAAVRVSAALTKEFHRAK
jgi:hypothetical protein